MSPYHSTKSLKEERVILFSDHQDEPVYDILSKIKMSLGLDILLLSFEKLYSSQIITDHKSIFVLDYRKLSLEEIDQEIERLAVNFSCENHDIIILGKDGSIQTKHRVEQYGYHYIYFDYELQMLIPLIKNCLEHHVFTTKPALFKPKPFRIMIVGACGGVGSTTISTLLAKRVAMLTKNQVLYTNYQEESLFSRFYLGVKAEDYDMHYKKLLGNNSVVPPHQHLIVGGDNRLRFLSPLKDDNAEDHTQFFNRVSELVDGVQADFSCIVEDYSFYHKSTLMSEDLRQTLSRADRVFIVTDNTLLSNHAANNFFLELKELQQKMKKLINTRVIVNKVGAVKDNALDQDHLNKLYAKQYSTIKYDRHLMESLMGRNKDKNGTTKTQGFYKDIDKIIKHDFGMHLHGINKNLWGHFTGYIKAFRK